MQTEKAKCYKGVTLTLLRYNDIQGQYYYVVCSATLVTLNLF